MMEIDRTTFSILFFFQFVDHNKTQRRNVELQCHTLFCYFSLYINMQAPFLTRKHIYLSLPIIFSVSIFYSILPLFIKFANDEDSHVLSIENVSKPTTFVFNRFKQASKQPCKDFQFYQFKPSTLFLLLFFCFLLFVFHGTINLLFQSCCQLRENNSNCSIPVFASKLRSSKLQTVPVHFFFQVCQFVS